MKLKLWHKKVLLGYLIGMLISTVYVPWHTTRASIFRGDGFVSRDYLGYGFLWSRPDETGIVEIDLTIVVLEIIALSAGTCILLLGRELWELWVATRH